MTFLCLSRSAASSAAFTLLLSSISMPVLAQTGAEVHVNCAFSAAVAEVTVTGTVTNQGQPLDGCGLSVGLQHRFKGKWTPYGAQVGAGLESASPDFTRGAFSTSLRVCGQVPYPRALRAEVVLQCGTDRTTAHCADDRSTPGNQSRVRLPRDIEQLCDELSNN